MKKEHTKMVASPQIIEINLKKGEIITITGDMIIGDVVLAYPETLTIFKKLGIHCVGCYASTFESIQEGVSRHGLNADKVCKILNQKIKKHHNVRRNSAAPKSRKQ